MKIIKDRKIVDDTWTFVADDAPLPDGDTVVTLDRWRAEKDRLLNHHSGNLGIRLEPDQSIAEIADNLDKFQLIELNFPVFTDGRNFSQARQLRKHYLYSGEIRAVGTFLRDQLFYLYRVGFDSMSPAYEEDLAEAIPRLDDFTVTYQQSTR